MCIPNTSRRYRFQQDYQQKSQYTDRGADPDGPRICAGNVKNISCHNRTQGTAKVTAEHRDTEKRPMKFYPEKFGD
jgi:hypothetical protein